MLAFTGVSVQLADGVKVPGPEVNKLAVPLGGVGAPLAVSITVAVHVTPPPTTVGFGVQLTEVEVDRTIGVKKKFLLVKLFPLFTTKDMELDRNPLAAAVICTTTGPFVGKLN